MDPRFAAFLAVATLLSMVPAPDMALVTAAALRRRRSGILTGLGCASGVLVHASAAGLGISALVTRSAAAFTILKIAGAAYLILLGCRSLISARRTSRQQAAAPGQRQPGRPSGGVRAFRRGLVSTVCNPKAVLLYVTLLPQFIQPVLGTGSAARTAARPRAAPGQRERDAGTIGSTTPSASGAAPYFNIY